MSKTVTLEYKALHSRPYYLLDYIKKALKVTNSTNAIERSSLVT